MRGHHNTTIIMDLTEIGDANLRNQAETSSATVIADDEGPPGNNINID